MFWAAVLRKVPPGFAQTEEKSRGRRLLRHGCIPEATQEQAWHPGASLPESHPLRQAGEQRWQVAPGAHAATTRPLRARKPQHGRCTHAATTWPLRAGTTWPLRARKQQHGRCRAKCQSRLRKRVAVRGGSSGHLHVPRATRDLILLFGKCACVSSEGRWCSPCTPERPNTFFFGPRGSGHRLSPCSRLPPGLGSLKQVIPGSRESLVLPGCLRHAAK